MSQGKTIIVWSLTGVAIIAFWFSLRTTENEMEYTLLALAIWGIAFGVNRIFKNEDKA